LVRASIECSMWATLPFGNDRLIIAQ